MHPDIQAADQAQKQLQFLETFAGTGNVTQAAKAAGVGRRTHYDWLRDDAEYAAAFADATDEAADLLAGEARRRAMVGDLVYKFAKDGTPLCHPEAYGQDTETGELKPLAWRPYFERRYSDALLTLLLKANRPELYSDRHRPVAPKADASSGLLEAIVGGGQ